MTGTQRSPLLPGVPTIAEAGWPNCVFETWFMVVAPAATPPPVIDKLNATLTTLLQSAAVKEGMAREGLEAMLSAPLQARTRLETEMPKWTKLVKECGITAE